MQNLMHHTVKELLKAHGLAVESAFTGFFAVNEQIPARLLDAITYSFNAGGKRLRPALVLESFAACNGAERDRDAAVKAACAIELIHTFSLVHDDLPAMDDDDLRRGKPTNHKVFGEAMAILAGDAMTTMAFELLSQVDDPAIAVRLINELSRAAGPSGMIGGQVLDIDGEGQSLSLDQLTQIHRMKTGALLKSAVRLGAITGGAGRNQIAALTEFGVQIGLAFQIIDDVLDVTSTAEQLGKVTGKDAGRGKNTYPALMGLDASKDVALEHLTMAIDALVPFEHAADGLRGLARYVVERHV